MPTIRQIPKKDVKVIIIIHGNELRTQLKNTWVRFIDLKDIWSQIVNYASAIRRIKAA